MAVEISSDNNPSGGTTPYQARQFMFGVFFDPALVVIPSGALRIGGDSPNGLVLVGAAPAARTVDLFDREEKVLVATTVSASDGTYAFSGLSARTQGYDVVIRGVIGSGERDVIIPGMHPG